MYFLKLGLKLAAALAVAIAAPAAFAGEISVPTIDFPPLAIHGKDGKAAGIGIDLVREISKRSGLKLREALVPVGKLPQISEHDIALIPIVARNVEREKQYRWVGKIMEDKYCFVTLKGRRPIATLEEAKSVKAIGVNQGGATETFLKKNGLSNIDSALGNAGSIRKLKAGKIDAWFTSERVAFYSYRNEGNDPDSIVCTGDLARPTYWVGASTKMSEDQFNKAKSAFSDLEKEGFLKNAIQKYEK